jgi:hypothetical protein
MITVIVIGAVTALAMFAILAKMFAGEPEGTEKLQKGDILKQLLALSELDGGAAKSASPARPRSPQPDSATRPGASPGAEPTAKASNSVASKPSLGAGHAAKYLTDGKAVEVHPGESLKQ